MTTHDKIINLQKTEQESTGRPARAGVVAVPPPPPGFFVAPRRRCYAGWCAWRSCPASCCGVGAAWSP